MPNPPRGVDPADAYVVLKSLLDTWDLASERMLQAVARRLARGILDTGWTEEKARETLAVRDELAGILRRAERKSPDLLPQAAERAYGIGRAAARTMRVPVIASRPAVVQRLAEHTLLRLRGVHVPVIRAHSDLFSKAVAESEMLMATGTITRREAVASTVDKLLHQGEDRFRDSVGRRWHLDTYARMAGRTMAQQAAVEGQLEQMRAEHRDVIVVSDSVRECARCAPWEGRLLSITGGSVGDRIDDHPVVGTVAEARTAGLWHPNCRHRADPYVQGLTRIEKPTRDPVGYEAEQRQRALERGMRELKRRQLAASEFGDTDTARKLRRSQRELSARINAHVAEAGLRRKRDREQPVS